MSVLRNLCPMDRQVAAVFYPSDLANCFCLAGEFI